MSERTLRKILCTISKVNVNLESVFLEDEDKKVKIFKEKITKKIIY